MANLLPIPQQRAVLIGHELRFAAVAAGAAAVLGLLSLAAVVPSYVLVTIADVPATSVQQTVPDKSDPRAELSRSAALLEQLAPLAATTSPSTAIALALSLRPKDVHVRSVSYTAGVPGRIVLDGAADTAAAIDSYRGLLYSSGSFSDVSVPVTALIGTTRGEFTITLSGSF